MTIVDTSVWIEFFEGGSHWTKDRLKFILEDRESIAYIDFILLEIVQGIRTKKDREKIEKEFNAFVRLEVSRSSVMLAAEIYQELQRKGFRVRSNIDCLISAVALETGAKILHKDRDFDFISDHYSIVTEKQ